MTVYELIATILGGTVLMLITYAMWRISTNPD